MPIVLSISGLPVPRPFREGGIVSIVVVYSEWTDGEKPQYVFRISKRWSHGGPKKTGGATHRDVMTRLISHRKNPPRHSRSRGILSRVLTEISESILYYS